MTNTNSHCHRIQPLTIKTPFFEDESITSWLIRATLNQGCKPETFLSFYWDDKSLWKGDTDKGFNDIDKRIHADMAVLAESTREQFDNQAETVKEIADSDFGKMWLMPLSKAQTVSGAYYCPLCFSDNKKSHLKTNWRMLWYSHCHIHKIPLQSICIECQSHYKPLLLPVSLRFINHCHECGKKLDLPANNRELTAEEIVFEDKCLKIMADDKAVVFGNEITANQWFDYMGFLIEFIRSVITLYSSRQVKHSKALAQFLLDMGVDIINSQTLINSSKTHFHLLPHDQRSSLILGANQLAEQLLEKWLELCKTHNVSRAPFNFNGKKTPPFAFFPIYERLPRTITRARNIGHPVPNRPEFIASQIKDLFEKFDSELLESKSADREKFECEIENDILNIILPTNLDMNNIKDLMAELYAKPKPLSHNDFLFWVQLGLAYFHETCISLATINTCQITEEDEMLRVKFLATDYCILKP